MATEADVPEPISSTQRVGEDTCLISGLPDKAVHETPPGELKKFQETLGLPRETAQFPAEHENMQAADNVGTETMNSVSKGNVETPEGERFLESASAAAISIEETCMASKHCQADEESFQDKMEMSENKKQMQEDATNGISQETGSGENNVVEDSEEKAETHGRSCDTVHLIGTSLQVAKIEELNLGIRGEESLKEESYVDQHVDVIKDQQDSAERESTNKETVDMQKNKQDADTSLEPNKGVLNTTGVTLNQNEEAPIHIPDPRVISWNKDIETAAEPCNEAESIKAKFTGEEIGKTSSELDEKEAEKSAKLVGEEESSEATRLSEGVDNKKDEKDKAMNYTVGDSRAPRLTFPDIQSEEESMSEVRDIKKEPLYKSSVRQAGDASSVHEAGPETGEKHEEVSSISCEEENNNKVESSEKMEQTVPVEDEMNHNNNIDTPFAVKIEETRLQQLENPELLKVVPKSWSDDIIKDSPIEVREKTEKTAEGDTTSNESCKDNENPEQEEESSFMKHEGTSSMVEVLAATEMSSGDNRDEGGSTVVLTDDKNDDTKITKGLEQNHSENWPDNSQQNEPEIEKLDATMSTVAQDFSVAASNKCSETIVCDDQDAPIKSNEETIVESIIDVLQQSQSGTSNNEEKPEKLQQNEPEKETLDRSSSLINADLGTTASTEFAETIPHGEEEAPIKSHEESFAEKIAEDLQTHNEPIIETVIPEDKNIPAIEMIDDSEVHVPNKDANDLQIICPSTKAAIQIESKELDVISDCEPKGQTHEAYKASTEQKHIEDAPEASQSSNCSILEHTSTEKVTAEPIPTSRTDVTKLQEAHGLDSEENSMLNDSSESRDHEMKTNEEACHTVTHEILAKGDEAGKDINAVEASGEVNRAISVTEEIVEQNFHIESPPPAPRLTGEDETYNPEDNAQMNNITNQQVHEGTNFAGSGEAMTEQVTESSVAYNSQESIEQETVESPQLITKEAEKSEGENNSEQIIEDDNNGCLVDPVKNLNAEKQKAEESKGEVNWTVNQTATEASPEKKRNEDISSHHGDKISNDTQIFSSSADKIPCLIKEGAPSNLEETAQKEERVNETEENNNTTDNKIAMEEDLKLVAERSETSTESIVLEPKTERDVMVVEDDTKMGESEQDLKLIAETFEASTKSIVFEPKSEREIMVVEDVTKKEESEQDLKSDAETSEASTKGIVMEPESEKDIMVVEDDTEKRESKQDLQLVVETSEASTESIVLEPESERDIMVVEDVSKKEEPEQDLKFIAKIFEASTESIVLEPKSERDIMLAEIGTKGESEELNKDSNIDGEDADIGKQNTIEECVTTHILPEAVGEKSLNNFKENQNDEDIPKTEVYAEPHLTSASDDAGRQLVEEENTVDQCKELEEKKTIQSSKEDDTTVGSPKQDSDTYISVESIEQEIVESSQSNINKVKMSDVENRREWIIEEGLILESIEKSPTQDFNEEKQKTPKSTGEILENFEIKAVESIVLETSKTTESTEEILDISPVKEEEIFLDKGKKTEASLEEKNEDSYPVMVAEVNNSTRELLDAKEDTAKKSLRKEADLEHILQKQEQAEKLEQSLSMTSDGTETFSSKADKFSCLMVEGGSEHLEETAKTEEEAEENNEVRPDKVATEEELEVVSKTYDASKSIESIVLESNLEMDKLVGEDNTRKGESEEVHVEHETASTGIDAEKQITTEESIVEQGRVIEVEKFLQTSEEDDKIANVSKQGAESIEQETAESSKCITDNAEESEAESNEENAINRNIKDIIPESIGQDPIENLNDEEMKANKSSREIFEISKTAGATENIAHEAIETLGIVDTSLEQKRGNLQNEGDNPAPLEASPDEKDEDRSPVMMTQENTSVNELLDAKENIENIPSKTEEDLEHILHKNESGEKLEQLSSKEENETEAFSSNDDKIPQLEEGASQNEEAAKNEEIEQNSDDNKIAAEDLKVVAETSDASKTDESIALETKSGKDKTVDGDNTKNREYEELSEDTKDMTKGEDNEKESIVETCHNTSTLPEPVEEKAPFYKQVHVTPDTSAMGEEAEKEKHITMEENTIKQYRVLNTDNIEENSEEDKIGEMSKQGNITYNSVESVEQETVENSQGNTKTAENPEAGYNNEYTTEDGNMRRLKPESVEQDPVKNLNDEKTKAEKPSEEILEVSKTVEVESFAPGPIETFDIIHALQENKRDNLQTEGENLTPIEASPEEKDEDRSPVTVAQDNSSTNELLDAKVHIGKDPSKTEDVERISQKNETGENADKFLSKMVDKTEALSSNAGKIPQLMEEGASQNEESASNEEEADQNNETEDNKIDVDEELKAVAETFDASRSEESITLEPKSETDKIEVGDETKNIPSEELSEDSKDTVNDEDTEKQNIVEACHTTSILPKHIGEQAFQSSTEAGTEEVTPKIEVHEITQTVNKREDAGKQNIVEGGVSESNIEVLVQEIDEQDSLRDENKDKEHEEEVDDSSRAFIENNEATVSDKETASETLNDRAEPIMTSHHLDVTEASEEEKHPKEIKEELTEKSILLSETSHEDGKEEIGSKEESLFDYSDSVSVTMVKEEAGLQETEAEGTNQVESFDLVSKEKGVVETETREIMLDSGDIKVTPEDTSNLSDMMDRGNPEMGGEDRIDKEQQNQVPHAVNEDQEEVATNTTPLKETLEDELNKFSTMASEEHKLESSEACRAVDETPENTQAPDENKRTTFITEATDNMLMQKHDNTNPLDVSELRSIETEKENSYRAQKNKVDDLHVHPELENEKDLSILEDVKILKREEMRELTDQTDICTSKTLQDVESSDLRLKIEETKDGKPFDEALKSAESSSVHTAVEIAIIEQEEISEGNFHEGFEGEKAAIKQKEEAYSEGHEDTSTKDDGTLTEENFESVERHQKFEFASELVAEDENKQIFPESDESKIEENNKKKQQDEKEIKEEDEPTLVAEENKEPNANEIKKAVISAEKATGREQLDDIEDFKEAVAEKEHGRNELHALSTVGEITSQVKDSTLVCGDGIVSEPKEKTDTVILEVEEDSVRQREVSFATQSDEQKPKDVGIETLDEELEETKREKILEESEEYCSKNDNADVAIVTAEKSMEQAEQVDISKLKETSSDLTSNLPTVHDSHAEQESITVQITDASECEETEIVSEAFYKTKDWGTEQTDIGTTVEKKYQVPSLDHDHAEKEYATSEISDKNEVEEIKIASAADQITEGTSEIEKSPTVERMDQVQNSNSEQEEKENMAVENLKANEVSESKVSSDANYISPHQGTKESAEKISTVEILDQVPISNSEHASNESVTEENPDADATNMASNVVFKSEDKDTENNDDIRESPTAEKRDAYRNEEASTLASDYRAHGDESVGEDEITTDRTVSTEILEEELPPLASATTTTIEKVEEEKTKETDMLEGEGPEDSSVAKPTEVTCLQKELSRELDFSTPGLKLNKDTQECPTEVHEEEGQIPDAALQLKPQANNNKIECGQPSSESKDTTGLTGQTETGADLKFRTSEKTIESEMVMHNHGLTESEDTEIKEKHSVAVITAKRAEEKQSKQISKANEITQNEVSNREIIEEKEVTKTHRPVSPGEETMNHSLQEDELKAEGCVAGKTNTININSVKPIQNEELSASTASKKLEEQVAIDDRSIQDPEQVSVVNKTIKETFPNEFEIKEDAKDAAMKLAPINQGEETNFGSGKTETLTPRDKELGTEISQEESIRESVHGSNLIQDNQESENTCVTTIKQIQTEADLIERPKVVVSTGNECISSVLQEGITEVGDFEPGHTKEVHSETKGIKLEGEEIAGDSEEEKVKEPVKMDTDKTLLLPLLQISSKQIPQVAEHVTKERELTASPEEIQTEEAERIQIREGKTGEEKDEEEEGNEHKKTDSSSDSPVIVDVTKDMDVKVAHKKSHGILSGVGSKVKNSISKVKKAITCTSSHHPKPVSPK